MITPPTGYNGRDQVAHRFPAVEGVWRTRANYQEEILNSHTEEGEFRATHQDQEPIDCGT